MKLPTIPAQPKTLDNELYQMLHRFIEHGDRVKVARELGINQSSVSKVYHGKERSRRIWESLVTIATERKKQHDTFLNHIK